MSSTPLGSPVVPEEYGMAAMLVPGSTVTCPRSGAPISASSEGRPSAPPITAISRTPVPSAPARAASSSAGAVTSSTAPESAS